MMNDISTSSDRPDRTVDAEDGANTDDADSSQSTPGRLAPERGSNSIFGRLLNGLRVNDGASLRKNLADALRSDTAFSPEERAMLHNILRLREVRVEDVMVPRAEIDAVDQTTTIGDLIILFEESGRSRMPVYRENLDDPRGMVHIRDLLAYITKQARDKRRAGARRAPANSAARNNGANGNGTVSAAVRKHGPFDFSRVDFSRTVQEAGIIRDVLFVPPSMLAGDLLERMQAMRTQMALVIDEYGGTDGLASLEDIVEMVVGDIEDEHDDEETMISRASEDLFIADARVDLTDLAEAVGPDFDIKEQVEEVDTLGGLLFSALGRIPARGEVVQALPGFEFHVLDADPRRVKRVRVVRQRGALRRRTVRADGEEAAQRLLTEPADKPRS